MYNYIDTKIYKVENKKENIRPAYVCESKKWIRAIFKESVHLCFLLLPRQQ